MKNFRIAAVVVTFNRIDKLKIVLEKILAQTLPVETIVVVDNASTDGTDQYLTELSSQNEKVKHLRLEKNLGGAGGFNKGMKLAYEIGSDYIWIMDDDCYAYDDALERLVDGWTHLYKLSGHMPGFACSLVKWHDTICEMNVPETVWDWPRFFSHENQPYALVKHCSFVSVLVHRKRVSEVGLPIADFFIWFDDVEYTKRLAKSYLGVYVLDSMVHHDLAENKGVNFGLINKSNVWKYKYGSRNQAYYHKTHGFFNWLEFLYNTHRAMKRAKVPKSLKAQIYKSIFEGLRMKVEIEHVS
nr:glycosyltransferase family 2 protein [uncultured Cohaesibacter sp.]